MAIKLGNRVRVIVASDGDYTVTSDISSLSAGVMSQTLVLRSLVKPLVTEPIVRHGNKKPPAPPQPPPVRRRGA